METNYNKNLPKVSDPIQITNQNQSVNSENYQSDEDLHIKITRKVPKVKQRNFST